MKNFLPAFIITTVILAGCSTYKASLTPDDVYYSPAKPMVDNPVQDRYEDYSNGDDNYLRRKVHSHYQWSGIDDYGYWNDSRYDFGYSCSPSREVLLRPYYGYSAASPYYYYPWATWYNPAYTVVYYKSPKVYYGTTAKSNLSAYRNTNYYNNNRQSFGSLLKNAFNNNNTNNFNNTNPVRSFNTGTTPSNSAGGRSGGVNSTGSSASSPRPPR